MDVHGGADPAAGPGDGATRADRARRVAHVLRGQVLRGAFPGGVLPDEGALVAEFGTSRNTVREALGLLRDEGLVERRRGVGTVIVGRTYEHPLGELSGLAEVLQRHGTVVNEVRAARTVRAPASADVPASAAPPLPSGRPASVHPPGVAPVSCPCCSFANPLACFRLLVRVAQPAERPGASQLTMCSQAPTGGVTSPKHGIQDGGRCHGRPLDRRMRSWCVMFPPGGRCAYGDTGRRPPTAAGGWRYEWTCGDTRVHR
ncbi:GntR family transcriptional regulator [Streptomyces sp. NPDC001793]|uniref:GntR family transcriptional regulator n=1 Tax=Streptomyces sp. NPDC001793 TaxID=3154657 RepID=UPI0033196458